MSRLHRKHTSFKIAILLPVAYLLFLAVAFMSRSPIILIAINMPWLLLTMLLDSFGIQFFYNDQLPWMVPVLQVVIPNTMIIIAIGALIDTLIMARKK